MGFTCQYANNGYCALLSDELRHVLCASCHRRSYPKGTIFSQARWRDRLAVLVEGLTVVGRFPDPERPTSCHSGGLACTGTIVSTGTLVSDGFDTGVFDETDWDFLKEDNVCVLDTTVAVFDTEVTARLFKENIEFVQSLLRNIVWTCGIEGDRFHREQYSARSSVRYVVDFCRRRHLPELTHAQIALICNRSRPVVTEVLHDLLIEEPELFEQQDSEK